jgi:LPS O-antigen subunit length determinant protein (WzzB/FepE family)
MGSVPMRISRISENLHIIQKEISLLAAEELESSLGEEPFGEPDVKALRKVKSSVDHLRQVLRTYIDFASAQVDAQDSEEFQAARAERTTQILRFACQGLQLREGKNHEVPSSLFEQLMQLAFTAVDRHKLKAPAVEEELLQTAAD